jgi:hypothetical protein
MAECGVRVEFSGHFQQRYMGEFSTLVQGRDKRRFVYNDKIIVAI